MVKRSVILVILGAFFLTACGDEIIIMPDVQQDQIRVTGTATITAEPDIAATDVGVQTYHKEVDVAVAQNNRAIDAIISALRQQGIAEDDMRTSQFSIYPQRDYTNNRPNEIVGYQVNNMISVTMRDLDAIGETLQAAIDAGANSINGVNFTVEDPTVLRDEARAEAIKDARRRAEIMAEAAGIQLGDVTYISEMSYPGPVMMRAEYDKAAADSGVPIESGELELTISVEVTFGIKEG